MDFLHSIFWDNSILNYAIVLGSILLMLIIKRFLSRYLASILYRLVHRIWKNVEKKYFVDLVVEPLEWFLVILISVIAIDKLNFPSAWTYTLYGHSLQEIIDRLGIGIIIASFAWLIMRMIDFIAIVLEQKASLTIDKSDDQKIVFFRDFLKVFIVIGGILLIIKACFNQPIGQLLIGLSFVGAALAFAAKESLENLIASFIIFFDKPFITGDTLKVLNVTGTVERIGLRSTRIRTVDKTLVTVPNKQMVDSVLDNWSMRTHRRGEIKLDLEVATPAAAVKELTTEIKKSVAFKKDLILTYNVFVTELNRNGITVLFEFFTPETEIDEFNTLKEELNIDMKILLEKLNITLARTTLL